MPDDQKLPPPSGDSQRAESYVNQLADLISQNKLKVNHTDLSKFDPSSLHDHYSLDLNDYQVEISHSKQPTTGRDSYVVLFNNIKNLSENETQKEILAYLIINEEQFKKLKDVADEQIETLKKIEEEKRFQAQMSPVDQLLEKIAKGEVDLSQTPPAVPALPTEPKEAETAKTEENKEETPPIPALENRGAESTIPTQPNPTDLPAIATPDTVLPNQTTQPNSEPNPNMEPLSPLAQAAALPIPEKPTSPAPIVEEIDQTQAAAPTPVAIPAPEPAPFANLPDNPSATDLNAATSLPAENTTPAPTAEATPATVEPTPTPPPTQPTPSIEQVQQALAEAYAKSPATPPPPEFRPGLGDIPQPVAATPVENSATNPSIDQALDQAFQPTDNSVLTHASQTPNV